MNATNSQFEVGEQPCASFKAKRDGTIHAEWDNRRECYKGCGKTVSFCESCYRDHHEDGYQSCISTPKERPHESE